MSFRVAFFFLFTQSIYAQHLDTLVDVGGYNMHFSIMKGEGTPILFEAGAGNDGSVWSDIIEPLYEVTGTTIIRYDRSGFGESELNPTLSEDSEFGIRNGITELEIGLKKLGFDDDIILVSHSYGGFYNTLFASRNPEKVKHIVLIDVVPNTFWTDELLQKHHSETLNKVVFKRFMGMYYLLNNYQETARIIRNVTFPSHIPITNIFSEKSYPNDPPDLEFDSRWVQLHHEFPDIHPNSENIVARGSAHYIFKDNPTLVINAIIKAYLKTVDEAMQNAILKKALDNAIELSVEAKKIESEYYFSDAFLTTWGNRLSAHEEVEKALAVYRLNTLHFPKSWEVFDSYAEALLNANRKLDAIEMYEKSIELNPENKHAQKMLLQLKQN